MSSKNDLRFDHIEKKLDEIHIDQKKTNKYLLNQSWRLYTLAASIGAIFGGIGHELSIKLKELL